MENKIYHGFTLVELMVVVVIIGILAAIAIPNFVKIVDKSKEGAVKSNMHTVQVVAELYSLDPLHPGRYPANVAAIIATGDLPSRFRNPFSSSAPALQNHSDVDVAGTVEYLSVAPNNTYTITGIGRNDQPLDLTLLPGTSS